MLKDEGKETSTLRRTQFVPHPIQTMARDYAGLYYRVATIKVQRQGL